MKYLCTGVNKETGARMTLEFDASSKAAAERKATQSGMEVLHSHEVHEGELPVERQTHRGEDMNSGRGGKGRVLGILVVLVIVGITLFLLWPRIQGMLRR